MKKLLEFLSGIPTFIGLAENQLKEIRQIVVDRYFTKDELIFSEGDHGEGFFVVSNDKRDDRRFGYSHIKSQRLELPHHRTSDGLQPLRMLRFGLYDLQGRHDRGDHGRRHAGCENQRSGEVLDVINDHLFPSHKASDPTERLGESTHEKICAFFNYFLNP